jgi:prevent-host-death family protein
METTITSTEAARHLGDFLARVKHAGESFLLTRSDKPLARLVPVRPGVRAKGAEIMHSLAHLPLDPDFADDLERVNSMDRVPDNPWASSLKTTSP